MVVLLGVPPNPPLALHGSVPAAGAGCLDIANASQAQKARMLYGSARSCHYFYWIKIYTISFLFFYECTIWSLDGLPKHRGSDYLRIVHKRIFCAGH